MSLSGKIARAAVLVTALALVTAVPAYAATTARSAASAPAPITASETPQVSSCTSHGAVVCIYANDNFNGGPGIFSGTNPDWGADLGSSHGACVAGVTAAPDNRGGWNDCVSSIVNNTGETFYFYVNDNCAAGGGLSPLVFPPGTQLADLGEYNDSLSSDKAGSPGDC